MPLSKKGIYFDIFAAYNIENQFFMLFQHTLLISFKTLEHLQ
jgi:hypothetical protein